MKQQCKIHARTSGAKNIEASFKSSPKGSPNTSENNQQLVQQIYDLLKEH